MMLREDSTSNLIAFYKWMMDDEQYLVSRRFDRTVGFIIVVAIIFAMCVLAGIAG